MFLPISTKVLPDVAPETEDEKVNGWRLHVLVEAGYPLRLAEQLAARNDVDLHQAVELVAERGCSHATAAEILL